MRQDKIDVSEKHTPLDYSGTYKFDNYDKSILKQLDIDARKSLVELSKKTGLSRDAVRNRIQKMVDKKVILAFTPIYNPPKMGFSTINYICISLYNPSKEQEEKFIEFLRKNKHVTYIASLIGKWDYILDIMTENPGHFDKVFKEIRQKFPDLIKDYEIYGVLQEYKYEEIGKLVYQ